MGRGEEMERRASQAERRMNVMAIPRLSSSALQDCGHCAAPLKLYPIPRWSHSTPLKQSAVAHP
jgi:hypothetical protein